MALRATDMIEKSCLACNSNFNIQYRETLRGKGKFCSRKCCNSFPENKISKRNKQVDKGNKDTYRRCFGVNEHRVVMERVLGRKLIKGEIVHHIDGNKRNNHPDNLQLYSNNSEHLRDHLKTNVGKCVVDSCAKDQKIKNMCSMHYARLRKLTNLGVK